MKFEPEDHWVNNPLISADTKVAFFEEEIARAEKATEQRIIKLLRTELGPYLIWADDTSFIKGIDLDGFIALIKGENK